MRNDYMIWYILGTVVLLLVIGVFVGWNTVREIEEIDKKAEKKTRDDGCYEL